MVRTMIPFPPRDRDADRFVADLAHEEQGGTPSPRPETNEVQAVWDALGRLDAADFEIAANDARPTYPSRRALVVGSGLAAGVAVAVGAGLLWTQRPVVHETDIGERRTVLLADGSQVTLNTATRIEVRLSDQRRLVTLDSGEAFFAVAHRSDAAPFDVVSDGAHIRVTGTRFNVRRDPRFTQVDLVDGRVSVGPLDARAKRLNLRPGQGVRLDPKGVPGPVVSARLRQIADWRDGRISFDQTPLADAVAEMNRYSRIRLTVADPSLALTPVDGVFTAGDSQAFVQALHMLYGVSVDRHGETWTLSR
jgi:transmembrane sensor